MKWTNVFALPGPLVEVIQEDLYHTKRGEQLQAYKELHGLPVETKHYSVSDLIKPPRMRELISRHYGEIVKDVSGDVFRLLGQLFHHLFRDSAMRGNARSAAGYIPEKRLFHHIQLDGQTVIISGEPDLVSQDGVLDDYKVTGIYGWDKGVKIEWEQQMNCYAWLRRQAGLATTKLRAVYILRDWKHSEAVQEGYPQAPAMTMDVTMWPDDVQDTYILDRARAHQDAHGRADDRLPECTPAEMWEKPEAWAVIRQRGKRAAKVYKASDFPAGTDSDVLRLAAGADAGSRNLKLKAGEPAYDVEHRPGERTRCATYCDARGFCDLYSAYKSAAYKQAAVV